MVIEWLTFEMAPEHRERFIQADTEIWTAALSQYSGFVSKEIWIDPARENQVTAVIRWSTREAWKSIPGDALEPVAQRFNQALEFDYEMVESREFQVRRFPTTT
ncbi:TIGR03792 family protein [filamentous cyanobacterium CCP5]|nr:TIGR03792 family protein [filamentous cyanobacterium CCP5]